MFVTQENCYGTSAFTIFDVAQGLELPSLDSKPPRNALASSSWTLHHAIQGGRHIAGRRRIEGLESVVIVAKSEARALERVVSAAREVQAASLWLEAHYARHSDTQPTTVELAQFAAAMQELKDAREAFDALVANGTIARPRATSVSRFAG